jgi:hypothetical protein
MLSDKMRTLGNILRDLDKLCDQLDNISSEIEERQFDLSENAKENLVEKHILLATSFGVLETTFNRVASCRTNSSLSQTD